MRKVLNARDKRTRNTGKKKRRKRKHYEIDDRVQVQLKGELNSEVHRPEDRGRRKEQERNKGTEKKEGKMVTNEEDGGPTARSICHLSLIHI